MGTAPGRSLRRTPDWLAYALATGLLAALYLLGPLNSGPVYNVIGASSAVAVALGAARHRPRGRGGWYLVALGEALFVAGDVLAYNYDRLFGAPLPFPSVADPVYLLMYPCMALGLLVLARRRRPARDRAGLIDALIVSIGVGTLSWAYLIAPYAYDASLTMAERVTSIAYPVMDLLLLGVAVRLLLGGSRRSPSAILLGASLVALLGADAAYGWFSISGGYDTGGLLDGGWIAFYVLIGTAALHPSMRQLSEPTAARGSAAGLTRSRLALLAATSVLAPGVQLTRALLDQPREPLISVASATLFLLVLARLTGLVRVHEDLVENQLRRRYETRLAALVRHASDVVGILGRDGRLSYLSPSVGRLLGYDPEALIGVPLLEQVHPDDRDGVLAFLRGLAPGESGSAVFRLRHADAGWRDVETLATDLTAEETVGGIVLNIRDVSERTALERRLEHQAFHDALTGLPNRALFQDRVQQALARGRRHGTRCAVLFLDLDDFKTVNDSLGHAAGDTVLRTVAERLDAAARASDSAARLGGDEFALLLDGIGDEIEAVQVAERLMAAVSRPLVVDGHELSATPSVGIAFGTDLVTFADELLRDADAAMYLAKDQGKGRYAIFEPGMHTAIVERMDLEVDLKRAIEHNELMLVYQPIFSLRTGAVAGVEALVRWRHPTRGVVLPEHFVPLAEESGMIRELGRWVLRTACHQGALWRARYPGHPGLQIGVNVSGAQLREPGLVEEATEALAAAQLDASGLTLEITETALMETFETAIEQLDALKRLGVDLAIDDFGIGYSSLRYLRRLPLDNLKIEKSFVDGIGESDDEPALLRAIVDLADIFGLTVIAEGIERPEQRERLLELGCELGQGHLLSEPLAPADADALLLRVGLLGGPTPPSARPPWGEEASPATIEPKADRGAH